MGDAVEEVSPFSAASSMAGYLYQCRMALLQTLERVKDAPKLVVRIETLDDVEFRKDGQPSEIIQVKHHTNKVANLSDASTDLWRTIRIWCDLYEKGITKDGAVLYLMTTETAATDSAAWCLRADSKNTEEARKKLSQTAQTYTNKENKAAYADYLKLSEDSQTALLDTALVVDKCPAGEDIVAKLEKEIWAACTQEKRAQFLSYLEGWWFSRIIKSLGDESVRSILGEELDYQFSNLREQFKSDNLPIDENIKTAHPPDPSAFNNHIFVSQLGLINVNTRRIAIAVQNYYRAFEQRSRWLREDLLVGKDVEEYERKLIEEWEIRFEQMKQKLPDKAIEDEKVKLAQEIYGWVEAQAQIPIREKCIENFITRGSYHMLADRRAVGWHPDFIERLEKIFGVPT